VLSENKREDEIEVEQKARQSGKYKKVCLTDPDATMATSARNRRLEPCYKQHTAVDDRVGVILGVEVTTGKRMKARSSRLKSTRSLRRRALKSAS
jgi:hypothetical protein